LPPEHRRGHGASYDALNKGWIEVERLRGVLTGRPLPRCAGGRLVLAVDVSARLRPDAATSPDRLFWSVARPRRALVTPLRRRPLVGKPCAGELCAV
jgi:hypothetical protein